MNQTKIEKKLQDWKSAFDLMTSQKERTTLYGLIENLEVRLKGQFIEVRN